MTASDRFKVRFHCIFCGLEGEANVWQYDGWSFDGKTFFTSVTEGFTPIYHSSKYYYGDNRLKNFRCISCNVPVDEDDFPAGRL